MHRSIILSLSFITIVMSPAFAASKLYTLDLGHAHFGWEIDHFGYSKTVGQFQKFDGQFEIDEDHPERSKISFSIDASSIDSNHLGRDNHLRSAEYLDVEKFPEITFTSTDVTLNENGTGLITGDLRFRGVVKPFTLSFRVTGDAPFAAFLPRYDERRAVGIEAEGRFDRIAYGFDVLNFPGSPIGQFIDFNIHFDLVDCVNAPGNNIPCQYGRNTELEFPYE